MAGGRFGVLIAAASLTFAAHGCGGDSASNPDQKPRVCDPGTVFSCFRGGCRGVQTCTSDGTALSRCSCAPRDDEDAGTSPDASLPVDASDSIDASEPVDASAPIDAAQPVDAAEPPPEQCDNDRDDDEDGDIDCADSQCGERSCERSAGGSWKGPIALRSSDTSSPTCDGAFGEEVFEAGETPQAAAASCSACSCSPTVASCAAFLNFETGTEAACGGTLCATSVTGSCVEITPQCIADATTAQVRTALPSGASGCTPSAPTLIKPAIEWARRVVGCGAAAVTRGGCEAEELCLPKPPDSAGVDTELCVWREGDHDCPTERYTSKHLYHQDVDDTRACTACACSGPNCSYGWSVFSSADTTCSAPIIALTSAGQCAQANPTAGALRVGATIAGDGACTPSGGASQGSVSGSDPVTVCCRP